MIYGMLLSDARLQMHGDYARITFGQKNSDFINHIWELCKKYGIVGASPNTRTRKDSETGKKYTWYEFNTFTMPHFVSLFNSWYKFVDGAYLKILPANIIDFISPISLAYWIMGDGTYQKDNKVIILCTDNYTLAEVETLISVINLKLGIQGTVLRHHTYWRIRFNRIESYKLITLVKPHMHSSYLYRLGIK